MQAQAAINRPRPQQTILLVEDFDDTRLMMKLWLQKKGYLVIEAEDGEQAVELAQREQPDLIIMDMMMPGLGGLARPGKSASISLSARHQLSLCRLTALMNTEPGRWTPVAPITSRRRSSRSAEPIDREIARHMTHPSRFALHTLCSILLCLVSG